MNFEGLKERLAALRGRRARIDAEIEQLDAQLDAQERAGKKGGEILEVEPARGGAPTCCRRSGAGNPPAVAPGPAGSLHGPYWYLFTKKDGKTRSKYVGKNRTDVA